MPDWFIDASAWILPVLLAITLHEAAHGWMAEKFGDDTARRLGRVTFNPLKHIDRFGTILIPGLLLLMQSPMLFGYAKPVPVYFHRLRPQRLGMFMVALAGPGTNLLLAIISALLLHLDTHIDAPWVLLNLQNSLLINCVLAVFNMIPILPLDGGRVVDSLLPNRLRRLFGKLERYGIVLLLLFLLLAPMSGFSPMNDLIRPPVAWVMERVLWVTGNMEE